MKKLLSLFCVMTICCIGLFSLGTNKASAAPGTGWGSFNTEDGIHEGIVSTLSTDRNITVTVKGLWRASYTSGVPYSPAHRSDIKTRLCNISTGACTAYKTFNYENDLVSTADFTGMKVAKYKVDISDNLSGAYVFGQRLVTVHRW